MATTLELGVQTVDVGRLVVSDTGNDRTRFDAGELARLAADIDQNGQISPVIVRPGPGDRLVLVAGESRTRAIRDVLGRSQIVVDVRELTDGQAWDIMAGENLVRCDLDPVDEGRAFWRRSTERGWSVAECARRYGRSPGYVADRMALLALADDVADLVRTRQLTIGKGSAMSQLDHGRQRAAVRAGVDLSVDQFRRLVSQLQAEQDQTDLFGGDFSLESQHWDQVASSYVDDMGASMTDSNVPHLVGPTEVAELLSVSRATVAKWRERYPDFPTPTAFIGAGRAVGNRPASEGTPIWEWSAVEAWARSTGRLS